ncbi:HNH endonuclease [Vampirovibrio sp.]|uniref:HNH endonuclease n=1 Tax=Vampirovibrio sp. TaxID=2717857 RepID=UPI0035939282
MPLSNRVCFLVNLRDGLGCQQCGRQPSAQANYHQGFEYHHVLPRSQGGSDEPENIVLLCHACHQHTHQSGFSATLPDLTPVLNFSCYPCKAVLDSQTVEMNCGWYRCPVCHAQTHLFTHFQGSAQQH